MTTTPFAGLVPAGEHAVLLEGALGAVEMLPGAVTDGRLAVVQHPLAPRALGAPMHTHTREDEYTLVEEGLVGIQVGDEVIEAGPGDVVAKPRGVPHAFWNPTERPARLLEIIVPGAFAAYFRELGEVVADGPPAADRLVALAGRFGVRMDLTSVPALVERYGLILPA
ncbi:cupin domain-containing protein [Georgenia sp. SYP-B2076]|uniref:cupin domain-containing protein n=1 Tax=Georgenia sp. SYP-B2076 TaxID=2495881 RepID=UPI000F8D4BE4|nr:cupin domain-containing protein [Georgenia sp. SYP-B2076]